MLFLNFASRALDGVKVAHSHVSKFKFQFRDDLAVWTDLAKVIVGPIYMRQLNNRAFIFEDSRHAFFERIPVLSPIGWKTHFFGEYAN